MLLLLSAGEFASTKSNRMTLSAADELVGSLLDAQSLVTMPDNVVAPDEVARSSLVDPRTEEEVRQEQRQEAYREEEIRRERMEGAGEYQGITGADVDNDPDEPQIRYTAVASDDPAWNNRALKENGIPLRAGRPEVTGLRAKAENERISSYIASGIALAQVPACKAALERAHLNATCGAPTPGHFIPPRVGAVYSKTAGLAYFKTAKAGSVSFQNYFTERFNDTHCSLVKQCSNTHGNHMPVGQLPDNNHIFGFTFVRDPMDRALAGYAEVDGVKSRSAKQKGKRHQAIREAGTTYTSVPRKHGTSGTARFLAYLDDLANNLLPKQWKAGHSCRQLVFKRGLWPAIACPGSPGRSH